jgi:hypothetical protein
MTEYLGWTATAVFVGSYFSKGDDALRRVQMAGALLWVCYGASIGAYPVIVANLLVFAAAAWTLARAFARRSAGAGGSTTSR